VYGFYEYFTVSRRSHADDSSNVHSVRRRDLVRVGIRRTVHLDDPLVLRAAHLACGRGVFFRDGIGLLFVQGMLRSVHHQKDDGLRQGVRVQRGLGLLPRQSTFYD